MLPTANNNPNGLHQRYIITKANGRPVDPKAIYFVLRLDRFGRDQEHIEACQKAALAYADAAPANMKQVAAELKQVVFWETLRKRQQRLVVQPRLLLSKYAKILIKYGVDSSIETAFMAKYNDNEDFITMAKIARSLYIALNNKDENTKK